MKTALLWLGLCHFLYGIETIPTGFVTPTATTLTFTELRLLRPDGTSLTALQGSYTHEFKRADTDFSSVPLSTINIPQGRYTGAQICYNTERTVKLDGVRYQGLTSGLLADGALLYSVGSDALTAGAVSTSAPTAATVLTGYVLGTGTNNCSSSYFAAPVCIKAGGRGCESGDTVVNSSTTLPAVYLVMDLYHSVAVDASNGSLDNHLPIYPYPTIGAPGAAIHLAATSGAVGNVTLIFDSAQKLLYAASYMSTGALNGFCSGVAAVTATAAPVGEFLNLYGPTLVMKHAIAMGAVQFATGNCSGATCTSQGMVTLDNVKQEVGQTALVTCPPDSAAVPPYLGFTYSSGAGVSPNDGTAFTIVRVVDPGNILGTCLSGSAGFLAGSRGTCATNGGDGYP